MDGTVFDRDQRFDPAVEIARHPVGGGNEHLRPPRRQFVTRRETDDPAVLQKPADDTADPYVLRQTRDARPQATDAPNYQINRDPGIGGFVKLIDDIRVDQRVHLDDDPGWQSRLRVFDFLLDMPDDEVAHPDRRNYDFFQMFGWRRPCNVIEDRRGILAEIRIAGEERQVGVNLGRDRVIISSTVVDVWTETAAFLTDDKRHLRVGFQFDEAVNDLHAGALQVPGPSNVALFVEAGLELDERGDGFSRFRCCNQCFDNRRILACPVQRLLDRDDIRIGCRLPDKLDHHIEAFIRVMDRMSFCRIAAKQSP